MEERVYIKFLILLTCSDRRPDRLRPGRDPPSWDCSANPAILTIYQNNECCVYTWIPMRSCLMLIEGFQSLFSSRSERHTVPANKPQVSMLIAIESEKLFIMNELYKWYVRKENARNARKFACYQYSARNKGGKGVKWEKRKVVFYKFTHIYILRIRILDFPSAFYLTMLWIRKKRPLNDENEIDN